MSDAEEPATKLTKVEMETTTEADRSMVSLDEGHEEWLSESISTEDFNNSQDNSAQDTSQASTVEGNESQDISQYVNLSQGQAISIELNLTECVSEQLSPTFTQAITNIEQTNETQNENTIQKDENVSSEQNRNQDVTQSVQDMEVGESALGQDQSEQNVEATLNNMEMGDGDAKAVVNESERDILDELDTFLIRKSSAATAAEDKGSNERSARGSDTDDGHNTDELLEMLGEDEEQKKRKSILKQVPKKATLATAESTDDEDSIFHGHTKITHIKVAKNVAFKKSSTNKGKSHYNSDESSGEETRVTSNRIVTMKKKVNPNARTNSKSLLKTQYYAEKKNDVRRPTSTPLRTYSRVKPSQQESERRSLQKVQSKDDHHANEVAPTKEPQRIMMPEVMDEEMPSDIGSEASDESYYDEMPSSDSEGVGEWFALDIRSERAADYIPLLGYKAYDILTEEKERVQAKLSQLKNGLSILNESTKKNLAEIDDTRRKLDDLEGQLAIA